MRQNETGVGSRVMDKRGIQDGIQDGCPGGIQCEIRDGIRGGIQDGNPGGIYANILPEGSIHLLPAQGFLLAYFPFALLFTPYEIREGQVYYPQAQRFAQETPSECHFFDKDTDVHIVRRQSRGDLCIVRLTAQEEQQMDPDLLYTEDVLVREEYSRQKGYPQKLRIINRYQYSENDMLVLKNARISCC